MRPLAIVLVLAVGCDDPVPANKRFEIECAPVQAALEVDDQSELPSAPSRSLVGHTNVLTVLAPPEGRGLVDVSRLVTQLEGWGYTIDLTSDLTQMASASTIVVASSSYAPIEMDAQNVAALESACARGVDIVWIGLNVPPELADELGVDIVQALPASQLDVTEVSIETVPGATLPIQPEEWVQPLTLRGARAIVSVDDERALLTTHRATPTSCRATALSYAFGDYWSEDGSREAWFRVELVHEAVVQGTSEGTAVIELFPRGTTSIFMTRFEDIHPGGRRFHLNNTYFRERFYRSLDVLGDFGFRLNLSIVPRFVDPTNGEDNGWEDLAEGRASLLAALRTAIHDHGAALIAHGYTHQYGDRSTDYTGFDWEFSDDSSGEWIFLPYDDQYARTQASFDELEQVFSATPRTWETPHLSANEDTYRAATDAGFDIINERDGNLFPHVLAPSTAINVPHTGSFIPADGGAEPFARLSIESVMPRLFRMRAPFFFFYHGYDDLQESALATMATCASEAGAWGPTVEELADRFAQRSTATVTMTHVDESTMRVTIDAAPSDALVRIRIPEGHQALDVRVDGAPHEFEAHRRDSIAYAVVALDASHAEIEIVHGP